MSLSLPPMLDCSCSTACYASLALFAIVLRLVCPEWFEAVKLVEVPLDNASPPVNAGKYDPDGKPTPTKVQCWDPSTMDRLGTMPADSVEEVAAKVARGHVAQEEWKKSSFRQRRQLLKLMLRYIVEHQEVIAKVAVRDSGKTMVDAYFGEILVTLEKLKWTINNGEAALKDDVRATGSMMMTKKVRVCSSHSPCSHSPLQSLSLPTPAQVRVSYTPCGVIGALVSWNYPFHNVFNPMIAAVFAGNAIVIKVSEYASWSSQFYLQLMQARVCYSVVRVRRRSSTSSSCRQECVIV